MTRSVNVTPKTTQEAQLSLTNRALLFCKVVEVLTRKVWLPDGEKNSKICLFVLTWSINVTDGRTDRHRMTA